MKVTALNLRIPPFSYFLNESLRLGNSISVDFYMARLPASFPVSNGERQAPGMVTQLNHQFP